MQMTELPRNRAFTGLDLAHGHDLLWKDTLPDQRLAVTRIRTLGHGSLELEESATHYIYSFRAGTMISRRSTNAYSFRLEERMFAVIPGAAHLQFGEAIVISRLAYEGLFQIGGPLTGETGRLKYIDGCTDTLVAAPPRIGDPCLNVLYFPPDIDQTEHTHPSLRGGLVIGGRGRCIHRAGFDAPYQYVDLVPGMVWAIHTEGLHKFQTPYGESMQVLAYHPDSDHGPSDEAHPMLTRTIIEGVSAADPRRAEYRTK